MKYASFDELEAAIRRALKCDYLVFHRGDNAVRFSWNGFVGMAELDGEVTQFENGAAGYSMAARLMAMLLATAQPATAQPAQSDRLTAIEARLAKLEAGRTPLELVPVDLSKPPISGKHLVYWMDGACACFSMNKSERWQSFTGIIAAYLLPEAL